MKDKQERVDLVSESVVKNKERSPLAHLSPASCIGSSEDYAYLRLSETLWPHGSHTRLISHQPGIQTQASGVSQPNFPVLPLIH